MSKAKFDYGIWDFNGNGSAYIIAKRECPKRENVPEWIVEKDNLHPNVLNPNIPSAGVCLSVDRVEHGWCKYQVRTDWDDGDGDPQGGYYAVEGESRPAESFHSKHHKDPEKHGKTKPGWFPVWIVRLGDWC